MYRYPVDWSHPLEIGIKSYHQKQEVFNKCKELYCHIAKQADVCASILHFRSRSGQPRGPWVVVSATMAALFVRQVHNLNKAHIISVKWRVTRRLLWWWQRDKEKLRWKRYMHVMVHTGLGQTGMPQRHRMSYVAHLYVEPGGVVSLASV